MTARDGRSDRHPFGKSCRKRGIDRQFALDQPLAPAGACARNMPVQAVDDRIAADARDAHPSGLGNGNLVRNMAQPVPLVEAGPDHIPADGQDGTVTGAATVIPTCRNGRLWTEDCPAARSHNGLRRVRTAWASQLNALIRRSRSTLDRGGDAHPDVTWCADRLTRPGQTADVYICIALLNPFNALGTAYIECIARDWRCNGEVGFNAGFCDDIFCFCRSLNIVVCSKEHPKDAGG